MKIAIFTDSFLPGIGGTENAVFNYALALSKNHEVMVLAPKYSKEFADNAYPFKIVRAKSIKITDNDFWAIPKITKSLKQALKEFNPDILHTQTLGMMADFANSYGKKNNIPIINTTHTKYRYCYIHSLKSKFLAEMVMKRVVKRANNADKICTCSHSMIDELISYGAKKEIGVIKNGVIRDAVEVDRVKSNGHFNFLYVGMISTIKNLDFTLRSLALVKKEGRNDFTFRLIGRGSDVKKIQKLARKLKLDKNVEFIDSLTDKAQLNRYYAEADLFLFPSIFDNDPLVVLESANCQTPSLVLAGTGASERLTDNESGFISDNSEPSYAKKILELMNDREKIRTVGKNTDKIFTTWEQTATQYLQVYKELIENKKPS